MPLYSDAPQSTPRAILASPGSKTFLLGSQINQGGTMYITALALAANVGTAYVSSFIGGLPVVGTVFSIRGTSQQTGLFNVTDAVVTAVTLDATGTGTVTFALTGTNMAQIADGGLFSFSPQIAGEVVSAAGATIPASAAFNQGRSVNTYFFELVAPANSVALPTAATITPQQAMVNQDSAFADIASAPTGTIAAGAISAAGGQFTTNAPFIRFRISGVTGSGSVALALTF